MQMGTDLHCAILEPDRFEKEYRVIPSECRVGSGKGQKLRLAEFEVQAKHNGWNIINAEDMETIKRMSEAVRTDQDAIEIMEGSAFEVSGFWYDVDEKDVLCKIRPDVLNTEKMILGDLKKTTDARQHVFESHAHKMGYHMQAHWGIYGMTHITKTEHRDFRFIVVEDHEPWEVQVYRASRDFLQIGGIDCGKAFARYVECLKSDIWPGYEKGVKELNPPGWRMRKEMMMEMIIE